MAHLKIPLFVVLIGIVAFASPAAAQNPSTGTPAIHWWEQLSQPYQARIVPLVSLENSPRLESLLSGGKLSLSLDDAIALALENNLDVALQRFDADIASSDQLRASAGVALRGVPLTVGEAPLGMGSPAGPILNLPVTGSPFSSSVLTSLPELNSILSSQSSAAITGPTPLSNGPFIPSFEPSIVGSLNRSRQALPQVNPASVGTTTLRGNSTLGNLGFQKAFTTGTQLFAGFNANSQNSNATSNLYNPWTTSSFSLNLTQPLMRGFGRSVNRRYILIARNDLHVSDLVFREQVISTVAGVVRLYFDLVSLQEDVQVKQQTLALVQRLYDDNKVKVDQGTIAPIELVRAQAQMASARQDFANSQGFELQQELVLKSVLTRRGTEDPLVRDARIIPSTEIEIPAHDDVQPIQDLIAAAYKNRPELEEGRLQLANSEIGVNASRNALLPEVDFVASAQNNGFAGQWNSLGASGTTLLDPAFLGGIGTALAQDFRHDYPAYAVGIQLNLPLHNHVAEADYARDQIQLRQTQVRFQQLQNQIRLEVESALIALQRSRSAYDAATEARKLQEQSLQIEMEKFDSGVSTSFLVMQYQSFLAQAQSTEVAAKSSYVKAKTALERAIGMTLENHHISLDEAFRGQVSRPPTPVGRNAKTQGPPQANR
jgi:outer membrane protein TolC